MKRIKLFVVCFALGYGKMIFAQTDELRIQNKFLSAVYKQQTKTIELKDLASAKVFLEKGIIENVAGAVAEPITDAVFGKGQALKLKKNNGDFLTITLYPNLPFLFLKETVLNNGAKTLTLQSVKPFSFEVNLQKPWQQLKTLGTAGLLLPTENPGSYVFLTTVDPATREGVVTGWLTNEKGSGVVFSDTCNNRVRIKTQIDYGRMVIPAGASVDMETLMVGYFKDARLGVELFAATIARHQHIQLPPRKAVYCSWYSEKNGGAGNATSTSELAKFASTKLKPYGLGAIQIDDQWQDGGLYNGPARGFDRAKPNGPYPRGMGEAAQVIKQNGLTAGIWWMPFARNHQDSEYKDRQAWFARRTDGKPYETTWGGTSLDLTHPQVQQHLTNVAKAMKEWGYNYFKMDGLWTGTVTEQVYINDGYKDDHMGNCMPLFDAGKTQIEAFRSGLKLLRHTVGKDVFFSGCCVSQNMRSFGASIGLVDAMRVGPDFNHDGQSIRTGAIRASRLYFLNGRVWWNDPDPSIIRETGTATADDACKGIGPLSRARLLPSWVALTGQFFLSSDWLPDLPEERLEIMRRCMASHNGIARPVDAFDKTLPTIWLASDTNKTVQRNVIGLFNWDTTRQAIGSTTAWTGLQKNMVYHAFDFWENRPLSDIKEQFSYELPGESCKIIAVRAKTNHPVLVSTSRHITQGMVDVKEERWAKDMLSGESELVEGDDYELRIAGLNDDSKWKIAGMEANAPGQEITIEQVPSSDTGWARIIIQGAKSGPVKWSIRFTNR